MIQRRVFTDLFLDVEKTNESIEYLVQMKEHIVETWSAKAAIYLWPKKVAAFLENRLEWTTIDNDDSSMAQTIQDGSDTLGLPIEVKCNS